MEKSVLQAFRQAASIPAPAPLPGGNASTRLVLQDGKAVQARIATGWIAEATQPRQNHQVRQAFFQALSATYGERVASQVFAQDQRDSSAPLTPDLVRLAMDSAAVTACGDVWPEGSSLTALQSASGSVRASFSGADAACGSPIETKRDRSLDAMHTPSAASDKEMLLAAGKVGDFGHTKFLARTVFEGHRKVDRAAAGSVETKAETKAETKSTMKSTVDSMAEGDRGAADPTDQGSAMRALAGYEKSGALEVDTKAQSILDGARQGNAADVALERAVTQAMSQMKTPNDARSAIYKEFLRNSLLVLADQVMKTDKREGCPLLTQLASRLAEDMDGILLRAMSGQRRFIGKPHDEVVKQLASSPERTFSELPRLLTGLDTQMVTFQRTIHDLLERVETDSVSIGNTLLSGRAPGQVIDLHVTGSDPHHGGQRVMILKFEGAPDTPVVYKPRDCRVDAYIVGNAGAGRVRTSAGALINQALGDRGEIGTYNYLLGGKGGGEYAFIECIKHSATLPDGMNNLEGVKKFYRGIGQFLAMALDFGITDIHHGNGIVSAGGQMMFTDLEIAFHRDVFGDASKPLSLLGTMIDKNLLSSSEKEFIPSIAIDEDGLIKSVANEQSELTRNSINFEGRRMSPKDPIHGAAITAALKEGFAEAMEAVRRPVVNKAIVSLLNTEFSGKTHVRYHAAPTLQQLGKLEEYRIFAHEDPEIPALTLRWPEMEAQASRLKPSPGALADSERDRAWRSMDECLRKDFEDGDVAYFTRLLGQPDTVFHHDRHGAQALDDPGKYLAYDGLQQSINLISSLRAGTPAEIETKSGATQLAPAVAHSVDARIEALPGPVKDAFKHFIANVGFKPAQQQAPTTRRPAR